MKTINRYGKVAVATLLMILVVLLAVSFVTNEADAIPRSSVRTNLGNFTGPITGAGQDDNVKASLDLAHTDLDSILANQAGSGTLIAGQTYVIASSAASVAASSVQLFAVGVGSIEIISMFGECTVDMAASPGTASLILDATTGDYDADFTTAVNIDALNKGDIIQFAAVTAGEAVLVPTTGVNAGLPTSWFSHIGDIEQLTGSTGTGAIIWHMTFRPLVAGVTVTAY